MLLALPAIVASVHHPVTTAWRNASSVISMLPYVKMSLYSEDKAPATVQPPTAELIQSLMVLSSVCSDSMTYAKIQAEGITVK